VLAYYCVYYKKYPLLSTSTKSGINNDGILLSSTSCSPTLSHVAASPNAKMLQSNEEDDETDEASLSPLPAAVAAFTFNTKMIQ
jgi:hypothetical protein